MVFSGIKIKNKKKNPSPINVLYSLLSSRLILLNDLAPDKKIKNNTPKEKVN